MSKCKYAKTCGAYTANSITCQLGGSTYCGIYRQLSKQKLEATAV